MSGGEKEEMGGMTAEAENATASDSLVSLPALQRAYEVLQLGVSYLPDVAL